MSKSLARITNVAGDVYLVEPIDRLVDPGFGRPGGGWSPVDPGYGQGRPDRPDNSLPVPPVKPTNPIVLPPGIWPPVLPPEIDNSLPPGQGGHPSHPIHIPPDPSIGIEQPIYLPTLPSGTAILIALPQAAPKEGTPPGTVPALLWQGPGTKPVLVYVTGSAAPK